MNRFFTDAEIQGNTVTVTDETVHHIKNVLKLREGESVILIKNEKELLFGGLCYTILADCY